MPNTECTAEFRELEDFPGYGVSEDGVVWSAKSGRWKKISGAVGQRGYLQHVLCVGGKFRHVMAHVLVLTAFRGPRPTRKHESRHLDGCRQNNALSNLEWGTPQENTDDKRRHGTLKSGQEHHLAKVSDADVLRIRELHSAGHTQRAIAREFNLSFANVCLIVNRKAWAHV